MQPHHRAPLVVPTYVAASPRWRSSFGCGVPSHNIRSQSYLQRPFDARVCACPPGAQTFSHSLFVSESLVLLSAPGWPLQNYVLITKCSLLRSGHVRSVALFLVAGRAAGKQHALSTERKSFWFLNKTHPRPARVVQKQFTPNTFRNYIPLHHPEHNQQIGNSVSHQHITRDECKLKIV